MAISINPILPVIAAQGAAPEAVLQPGMVVDAKVQSILANNLVRIAIADLTIEVLSEIPLQIGQTLRLAVSQTAQGLRLAVVDQGSSGTHAAGPADTLTLTPDVAAATISAKATPAPLLTALEALSVSSAAQAAAARQGSLSPLYANLLVAAGSGSLPPDVRQVLDRLLALRPGLDPSLTGGDIKTAFRNSGLFLEASLAAGLETGQPAASVNALPDMKAALLVLREALSISVGDVSRGAPPAMGAGSQQAQQTASPMASGAPPLSPDFDAQDVYLPQALLAVTDDPEHACEPDNISPSIGCRASRRRRGCSPECSAGGASESREQ